jgi:dTDP-4-amino-4,6-dideoxygalactose transaminase
MSVRLPFLKLPLAQRALRRAYHAALRGVLDSGKLILGPEVAGFEREFAAFCRARDCVAVGNGTDALQIALRLSGVAPGAGAEVVTTPLTASFTAHAIVAAGAKPVFADIDPATLLIDTASVAKAVSKRTRALLPVHLYGQACSLNALRRLARAHGIALVQDAAQAHGTLYRGKPLAEFSDICCYSFYPTKNLGALGDGGALIIHRAETARRARLFRDGGRAGNHVAQVEAVNSRLDELQAAFLRVHLAQLKSWNSRRAALAAEYDELFSAAGIEEIQPVARANDSVSYFHLYVVRVAGRPGRTALIEGLAQRGVESGIHYEHPLHLQPAFRRFGYRPGDFPEAEKACAEIVSLPMHPWLSRGEVRRVVRAIQDHFRK